MMQKMMPALIMVALFLAPATADAQRHLSANPGDLIEGLEENPDQPGAVPRLAIAAGMIAQRPDAVEPGVRETVLRLVLRLADPSAGTERSYLEVIHRGEDAFHLPLAGQWAESGEGGVATRAAEVRDVLAEARVHRPIEHHALALSDAAVVVCTLGWVREARRCDALAGHAADIRAAVAGDRIADAVPAARAIVGLVRRGDPAAVSVLLRENGDYLLERVATAINP